MVSAFARAAKPGTIASGCRLRTDRARHRTSLPARWSTSSASTTSAIR